MVCKACLDQEYRACLDQKYRACSACRCAEPGNTGHADVQGSSMQGMQVCRAPLHIA